MNQEEAIRPVILIVEDEPLIMLNAVDVLDGAGFQTLEADSAVAAIEILNHRQDISAVFTDIQIVGEPDGFKLAHMVRDRWPPMGLLITSGRISPEREELPVGGTFLAKPYAPDMLVAQLKAVLPHAK